MASSLRLVVRVKCSHLVSRAAKEIGGQFGQASSQTTETAARAKGEGLAKEEVLVAEDPMDSLVQVLVVSRRISSIEVADRLNASRPRSLSFVTASLGFPTTRPTTNWRIAVSRCSSIRFWPISNS